MILSACILAALGAEPPRVAKAINDVPAEAPVGQRPYEMVWANRQQERLPLVDFENLDGWTVEMLDGMTAELRRSREQQMWGTHVARLTYRCTQPSSRAIIRPPQPIPIPGRFDCVNMWMYGNRWDWENPPDTPAAVVSILLLDAGGKTHTISFTRVRWQEWWLVHRRLQPAELAAIKLPCSFAGIEVVGSGNTQDRALFFDSLSFYVEQLKPLKLAPRPKRNLTLFEGQSPGLNSGPDTLPFPTREETILPTNYERDFRNEIKQTATNTYQLNYAAGDATIVYSFDAAAGLSSIQATLDGASVGRLLDGGGVKLAGAPQLSLESSTSDDKLVKAVYRTAGDPVRRIEYRLRIWQKSLVLDAICLGGEATELCFGKLSGLTDPKLIYVPFLTYGGGPQPQVLMSRAGDKVAFASIWFDWYRTNGSEPYAIASQSADAAQINGGVRYIAKTDGKRNDLFERVFITVSPTFEEVLPTIPNPPGLHADMAGERLWQESWGPADFEKEHARCKRLRAYGIDKLIQCNHEISWRDGGESFTLRLHAAPRKGGDEKQKWYVAAQQSLGWLVGLYTNYTDFAPVNEHWDEDAVQRQPDNEWRPAWPRCYALKPSRAIEFENLLVPQIKKLYGTNSSYTDVHTAVAPWGYNDYDARVPGAGTMAQTFYCYGELLRNDSLVYGGPIFSEGTYQWLYAGLADGNYGHVYNGINLSEQPYLPAFDLLKIHPLECDIGISWTSNYFADKPGWNSPENRDFSVDRFIAAEIAYGHIGWLGEDSLGPKLQCRTYYMMQQLQKRYALRAPEGIEYWDGERLVSTSQALASGAFRRSQMHIRYPGGLDLWINGNTQANWNVDPGVELPPAGWLARAPGFFEVSAIQAGRRVDLVQSSEYVYLDGRGEWTTLAGMTTRDGIAVRKVGDRRLEVIDVTKQGRFALTNFFGTPGTAVKCETFDVDGMKLADAEIRRTSTQAWFIGPPKALRYLIDYVAEQTEPLALSAAAAAPPGAAITIDAPAGTRLSADGGTIDGQTLRIPPDAKPGSCIWVKGQLGNREGWLVVAVVPLISVEVEPRAVDCKSGRATVNLRGAAAFAGTGADSAQVSIKLPAWLKVQPEAFAIPAAKPAFAQRLELQLANAPPAAEGELTVTAKVGALHAAPAFALKLEQSESTVRRFDDASWPMSWGICMRKQQERPGDPSTGAIFQAERGIRCGGVAHDGLFAHPPYVGGVGYCFATWPAIKLPDEPAELRCFVGLKDGGDPSDGVTFEVYVMEPGGQATRVLSENSKDRAWREASADLSRWAGREVAFRLVADVGPNDNSTADWASWGEPRIALKQAVPRLTIVAR